jgi:Na+-transporting methylmalonyl-CoA/oxaloacetate decarboxylase gamma subunit
MMILIILQLILVSTIPLLQRARYVSIIGIDFVFLSFDLIVHDLVVRTVRLAGTLINRYVGSCLKSWTMGKLA